VREHRDDRLGFADGEARLHVPVHTGPEAEFLLNGRQVAMAAGECWYVDVSQPHAVANRGNAPRVHLVIDCVVDEWLERAISEISDQA
jgi:mannose-6-phosphate isomerase-like protein (cupin superfamily)